MKDLERIKELSGIINEANVAQIQAAGKVAASKMSGANKMWDKAYQRQEQQAGNKAALVHYSQIYSFIEKLMQQPGVKPAEVIGTLKKIINEIAKNSQASGQASPQVQQ